MGLIILVYRRLTQLPYVRPSLKLDGTLSSILTIELANLTHFIQTLIHFDRSLTHFGTNFELFEHDSHSLAT